MQGKGFVVSRFSSSYYFPKPSFPGKKELDLTVPIQDMHICAIISDFSLTICFVDGFTRGTQ